MYIQILKAFKKIISFLKFADRYKENKTANGVIFEAVWNQPKLIWQCNKNTSILKQTNGPTVDFYCV